MSDLYAELPLAADLDAGDWTKVVGSDERTHLGTTDARHALTTHVSTMGDSALAVAGPRTWNSLPNAIRRRSSLPQKLKRLFTRFASTARMFPFEHTDEQPKT